MKRVDFLRKIDGAIEKVYKKDADLIDLNANERAIAHRLAVYLEGVIPGTNVDCEYNRYGAVRTPKALPGIESCKEKKEKDWIIPDILIHVRKSEDRDNFAAFEIKCLSKLDNCDARKLAGLTSRDGRFKYDFGVGVEFYRNYFNRLLFVNG